MNRFVWLVMLASALTGCGGGGGGTGGDSSGSQLQTGPTSAKVTVTTQAASAATVLYAAHFKLPLPTGVAVTPDATNGAPADAASGVSAGGALTVADGGAQVAARYVAATGNAPGYLEADIYDPGGFTVGKLATVSCTVTRGASVTEGGFALLGFSAWDANGAVMNGVDARLEVKLQ